MTGDAPTVVLGGTGAMGSRVVRRILATGTGDVRVLTRAPLSPKARTLAELSDRVRLVPGDLDDSVSLEVVMAGAARAFCNTDFFATGSVPGEIRQGRAALEAARAAGLDRVVWSSLDSAAGLTGGAVPVPHYDSKAAVAAWIAAHRADEAMRLVDDGFFTHHVSILTTAPYFENFTDKLSPIRRSLRDGRDGLHFALPLGDGRYPQIALDDIAWFVDHMLRHWQSWGARDLAVVGDSLTGREIAATFEEITGVACEYLDLKLDVLAASMPEVGHDYAALAAFLQRRDVFALDRDVAVLRRMHPGLQTFRDWLVADGATAVLDSARR
ncbi:NmrA family NAD(P)-binding protein [Rhodococcus sp. 06-418-5]|uniref:NmrA family NAD(P)-binding protein n=1 Tax=Rhodococcus sp. 06-418-5 TaxID=2022507 RepID=UPI00211B231D|nr:NmrA family NAD(P)-binding protein [Rhodococcus sp. 06-418-5]